MAKDKWFLDSICVAKGIQILQKCHVLPWPILLRRSGFSFLSYPTLWLSGYTSAGSTHNIIKEIRLLLSFISYSLGTHQQGALTYSSLQRRNPRVTECHWSRLSYAHPDGQAPTWRGQDWNTSSSRHGLYFFLKDINRTRTYTRDGNKT